MKIIETHFETGALHHAYLLVGEREEIRAGLIGLLEKSGVVVHGNPDVHIQHYENLTIGEGRTLKELGLVKPLADRKYIILSLAGVVLEAQNSLLKLFEDPTPNTHFFVIAPTTSLFIPTLLSRFLVVTDKRELPETAVDPVKFAKASIPKRLKMIAGLVEDKNKEEIIGFLDGLEAHIEAERGVQEKPFALSEIISAKRELRGRAPGIKILLEHIACIV